MPEKGKAPTERTVTSTSAEVAELRKIIRELERKSQFFEMLIRSLPGVFYVFDQDLHFINCNENMERVTGYSREEILHKSVKDLFFGKENFSKWVDLMLHWQGGRSPARIAVAVAITGPLGFLMEVLGKVPKLRATVSKRFASQLSASSSGARASNSSPSGSTMAMVDFFAMGSQETTFTESR